MAKDIKYINWLTGAVNFTTTADFAEFVPNFFIRYHESTDERLAITWADSIDTKIIISPVGVAYPGDAAPGTGPKKVTITFTGGLPTVIMTRVDNVDFDTGWIVITKGEHVVAWSPSIMTSFIVEPTT